jgi:hypothetical protein
MIVGVDDFIIRRRFGIVNFGSPPRPKKSRRAAGFSASARLT